MKSDRPPRSLDELTLDTKFSIQELISRESFDVLLHSLNELFASTAAGFRHGRRTVFGGRSRVTTASLSGYVARRSSRGTRDRGAGKIGCSRGRRRLAVAG